MTNDNGFAPCTDKGWFTLACCKGGKKGGMRKSAFKNSEGNDIDIYVLALCGKALAKELAKKTAKTDYEKYLYKPVYFAKIDKIISMIDYYKTIGGKSKGRCDDVYEALEDNKYNEIKKGLDPRQNVIVSPEKEGWILISKLSNEKHHLPCTSDNIEEDKKKGKYDSVEKDLGGEYVLCSKHYIYWGDKCGDNNDRPDKIFNTWIDAIKTQPRGYRVFKGDVEELATVKEKGWLIEDMTKIKGVKHRHISPRPDTKNNISGCGGKKK